MEVKKQRLQLLQTRLSQQGTEISNKMLGTIQKVLITGPSKRDPKVLSGRTENNRVVNIVAPASTIGQIVDVEITAVKVNTLAGELCTMATL